MKNYYKIHKKTKKHFKIYVDNGLWIYYTNIVTRRSDRFSPYGVLYTVSKVIIKDTKLCIWDSGSKLSFFMLFIL